MVASACVQPAPEQSDQEIIITPVSYQFQIPTETQPKITASPTATPTPWPIGSAMRYPLPAATALPVPTAAPSPTSRPTSTPVPTKIYRWTQIQRDYKDERITYDQAVEQAIGAGISRPHARTALAQIRIPIAKPAQTRTVQSRVTAPTPRPPTSSGQQISEIELGIHRLVNEERQKAGIKHLVLVTKLSAIARSHSLDMAENNYFSHKSLAGLSPSHRAQAAEFVCVGSYYSGVGENISLGRRTAEQIVDGWMNSPGHRKNILNTRYIKEGVGVVVETSGRIYATQDFC